MSDVKLTDKPQDTEDYLRANKAQLASADPSHPVFVMANAGSGKTKVLIDRVARLLLRREDGRPGAKPDSILCITYTKAAANEMLSRLFRTLGKWSIMRDEELREELSRLEGRPVSAYETDDLRAARALFARALETPGGLRIETIHAFCARILRRFPLEAGVLPGFAEIEEEEAQAIWQTVRADAVLKAAEVAPEALNVLALEGGHDGADVALDAMRYQMNMYLEFAEQYDFDQDRMRAALVDGLNAPEASPSEILSLAMGEEMPIDALREALISLRASGKRDDTRTADAVEAALSEEDPVRRWECYRRAFFGATGNPYKSLYNAEAGKDDNVVSLFATKAETGSEVARVDKVAAKLKLAETVERTSALLAVGLDALVAYQEEKRRRGALDFDDLIRKTRDLLTRTGMSDWVLYKLDGGISHILLDEAQDTSPEQWELINALTNEFAAGQGAERQQDPRTLFVVGDEKQSIYSFQGADPAKLRAQEQDYVRRDSTAESQTMEMSFRSSPEILSFVDAVWNSAPPIDVAAGTHPSLSAEGVKHTARRAGQEGLVELWSVDERDEDEDADAWSRPVNAMRSSSPKARLATRLAQELKAMVKRGEAVWEELPDRSWQRRAMRPEDILILVRSRTGGLFDAMISALKAAGLPVAGADRLKLTDHIAVQDCLNLMRFALLPERDLALAEILRGPFVGLVDDDRYLYPLASERRRGETLWSRVQASSDPDVQQASRFLSGLIANKRKPPYEFLSEVLDVPGTDGKTGWEKINARLGTPAHDPVEALLSRAQGFDASEPSSLQAFVAEMEAKLVEIKRDLAAPEGQVRVMTVHGAKGLQAPVVVMPDTTAGPKSVSSTMFDVDGMPVWSPRKDSDVPAAELERAIANAKAEEEFRRLLYVALTRAQDRLIIAGHWHGARPPGYHDRSWYALCQTAMNKLGGDADEYGVHRFGDLPPKLAPSKDGRHALADLPNWVSTSPDQPGSARRFGAPSSLLGRKTPVLAPFSQTRQERLRRGRIIHALLEYLPALPKEARIGSADKYLARLPDLEDGEREEMAEAVFGILDAPEMQTLFQPGGRAEAAIVGSAPELPDGLIVNGRVDRLVVTQDEVLIVDFKTDQPAPESPEGVAETYRAQMAAYWAVLRRAYPGRRIRTALCWTDGPRLMFLPEEMLLEALKGAQSVV